MQDDDNDELQQEASPYTNPSLSQSFSQPPSYLSSHHVQQVYQSDTEDSLFNEARSPSTKLRKVGAVFNGPQHSGYPLSLDPEDLRPAIPEIWVSRASTASTFETVSNADAETKPGLSKTFSQEHKKPSSLRAFSTSLTKERYRDIYAGREQKPTEIQGPISVNPTITNEKQNQDHDLTPKMHIDMLCEYLHVLLTERMQESRSLLDWYPEMTPSATKDTLVEAIRILQRLLFNHLPTSLENAFKLVLVSFAAACKSHLEDETYEWDRLYQAMLRWQLYIEEQAEKDIFVKRLEILWDTRKLKPPLRKIHNLQVLSPTTLLAGWEEECSERVRGPQSYSSRSNASQPSLHVVGHEGAESYVPTDLMCREEAIFQLLNFLEGEFLRNFRRSGLAKAI